MTESLIYDLLLILTAGLLAGLVCRRIGVSSIVGYLVVGALIGDGLLGWISDEGHEIEHLAEMGVFLLLFSIGLEFSLDDLARLGKTLLIGGSVQMTLVAAPLIVICRLMDMGWPAAFMLSSALAFSSTVLVFRALAESGQSTTRTGRRAIGILLFQDVALVPLLLVIPALTGDAEGAGPLDYLLLALKSAGFVVSVVVLRRVLARNVIPSLAGYRSPDLVVLFALVVLGVVTLAAYTLGLPPTIGAFAAGLIFSGNRWTAQVDALVLPFREIFAAIFFVSLGLLLEIGPIVRDAIPWLTQLLGLILLKAVAAVAALRLTGLNWKRSLGMGIGLAHVGEFAFVLAGEATAAKLVSPEVYGQIVSLALGSLLLTPPLIRLGLRWTVSADSMTADTTADQTIDDAQDEHLLRAAPVQHAVVIGMGLVGRQMASRLETEGRDVHLVDRSPVNLYPFAQQGFPVVAGDATQDSVLEAAGAFAAGLIIVCVPEDAVALRIVTAIRALNHQANVLVRCRYQTNKVELERSGADWVVSEEVEASQELLRALTKFTTTARP